MAEILEFWDAYWLNLPSKNILMIEHFKKLKENEKSVRYEVYSEEWHIENLKIVERKFRKQKITISKNKLVERRKFKTRAEAIDFLINVAKDEIELCKIKLEKLPRVVKILEELRCNKCGFGIVERERR